MTTSTQQDKQLIKERIRELVVDESSTSKSVLNAYRLKSELNAMSIKDVRDYPGFNTSPSKKTLNKIQEENEPYYRIKTLDPLIVLPEKRFEHRTGAVITSNASQSRLKPSNSTSSLTSSKSHSSSSSNLHSHQSNGQPTVHEKLYSQDSFPTAYRSKFDQHIHDVSGDMFEDRKRTLTLLKDVSSTDINLVGLNRSADLKSEVTWRLLLRNDEARVSTYHGRAHR